MRTHLGTISLVPKNDPEEKTCYPQEMEIIPIPFHQNELLFLEK